MPACVCVPCGCNTSRAQKRVSELELLAAMWALGVESCCLQEKTVLSSAELLGAPYIVILKAMDTG